MAQQLELALVDNRPVIDWRNISFRIDRIIAKRVRDMEMQGRVAYHQILEAEGTCLRTGKPLRIDFADAFKGIAITPREWKQDILSVYREYHMNAKRAGIFDAEYVVID